MRFRLDPGTRARLASYGTALLLLVIAALVAWQSTRHVLEADWTRSGRHTLSPASEQVMAQLSGPLAIDAYAGNDPELRAVIRRFVGRYRRVKPDIRLEFFNPDAFPDEARKLDISVNGELVLRYQGRIEHVRSDSEEEFTNAALRLVRNSERWLAFVEGHGERDALGHGTHDLGELTRLLKQRGYNFRPINLAQTGAIPDNTSVLVVAGPQSSLLPGEVALILEYVKRGGNLLWLADEGALHDLDALAAELQVELLPGIVIDYRAGQLVGVQDPTIALFTPNQYGDHAALKGFGLTSFLPTASAIRIAAGSAWQAAPLLVTDEQTWLETGELQGQVRYDEGVDVAGPLTVAVALSRGIDRDKVEGAVNAEQRVVIVADGDFVSNTYVANSGNLELALRLFNWLSHDEDLMSIPARTAGDTQLQMDNVTVGVMALFFILVLPLILVMAGVGIWWRRRRL